MKEIGTELAKEGLAILRGTKAFVLDQAPDFMVQVLAWQFASNAITLGLSLLVFGIFAYANWRAVSCMRKEDDWSAAPGFAFNMFLLIPALASYEAAMALVKIHYAPKVFLLEYFAGLLK